MPLPISTDHDAAHRYSFAVLIVLNFIIFVLVAFGQAAIYLTVKKSSLESQNHDVTNTTRKEDTTSKGLSKAKFNLKTKSTELKLAQRLGTVVVSDFLCWFPIGLLGLLASQGRQFSGEVNVVLAIFVMPLNSALNPFLYTLNVVLEKRNDKRLKRLTKTIERTIKESLSKNTKCNSVS